MNRNWYVVFLLSFLCTQLAAQVIQFNGVSKTDLQNIQSSHPYFFNGKTNLREVDQAIKAIMKLGNYESVGAFQLSNLGYTIDAKPIRMINRIEFKGNKFADEDDLIRIANLKIGNSFKKEDILRAGESLKEFYGKASYFSTIIEVEFKESKGNRLEILFNIIEGEPCRIRTIHFESSNRSLVKQLNRSARKFQKNNFFSKSYFTEERVKEINEFVNEYFLKNRYLSVKVKGPVVTYNEEKTSAFLVYKVSDPFIYRTFFKIHRPSDLKAHNPNLDPNRLSRKDLINPYEFLKLSEYDRSTLDPVTEITERVRSGYLSIGYPNVVIVSSVETIKSNYIRKIHLSIREGKKVQIQQITVTGRISREPGYYTDFIKNNSSPLIKKGFYNKLDLEYGYENLVIELKNKGFLKARVLSARVEYSDDKTNTTVNIVMDEGPLTQVRKIQFRGIKAYSSIELKDHVLLQPNSPLQLNLLEQSLIQIIEFYRTNGYLEAKILNQGEKLLEYNERGTLADILFEIYEGPQIIVDDIALEGNSFTKDSVVKRFLDFEIGDVLTPELIDDSIARLNKSSLFNSVSIRTLEENSKTSKRTVIVSIIERDPGVFSFGGGFNTERDLTLRMFTGVSYNNIFGSARAVSLRTDLNSNVAVVNYLEYKVSFGYLEPFVLGNKTRGRFNLVNERSIFETKNITNFVGDNEEVTTITERNRFHLLFEQDISKYTMFSWTVLRFDATKFFERNGKCTDPTDPNFGLICPSETQEVAIIGPRIDVDYRDNPFLPTLGSYHWSQVDYAHPILGSSDGIQFVRAEASSTYYFRLGSPRWIWANSLRGGYLENLSTKESSGVPANQAFFLGGLSTIRGYSGVGNERIPPRYELAVNSPTELIIEDHSHYYLIKSEIRFPIYNDVGGVIFYDGGLVDVKGVNFKKPFRQSVGFGIRYNTPVGPLALDIGFKIDPKNDKTIPIKEDPFRVHLSIGTF